MKFISIDLETTGLNPVNNQILEFGAVAVDTKAETPIVSTFRALFLHKEVTGNPIALSMNSMLISEISATLKVGLDIQMHNKYSPNNVFATNETFEELFNIWCENIGFTERLTLAGKNLATFDLPFLKYAGINLKYRHRIIDPGILYVNWEEDDVIPDLQTCIDRSNIQKVVTHTAVDDAMDVVNLILEKIKCQN